MVFSLKSTLSINCIKIPRLTLLICTCSKKRVIEIRRYDKRNIKPFLFKCNKSILHYMYIYIGINT